MKRLLKILLNICVWTRISFQGITALAQDDDEASAKGNSQNEIPAVNSESNEILPVTDQSKGPLPNLNPDTAGAVTRGSAFIKKKKRMYKNNYDLPSYPNHFRDNRIGTMVGQSDTRRMRKKKPVEPL